MCLLQICTAGAVESLDLDLSKAFLPHTDIGTNMFLLLFILQAKPGGAWLKRQRERRTGWTEGVDNLNLVPAGQLDLWF